MQPVILFATGFGSPCWPNNKMHVFDKTFFFYVFSHVKIKMADFTFLGFVKNSVKNR